MTADKVNQDECKEEGCANNAEDCKKDPATCLANSTFKGKASSGENMDDCLGRSLDQLSKAFMASARRWEMIVYPSLVAFIILAAYGFFLIYSLTTDISRVADDMNKIAITMERITTNMDTMTATMKIQSANMQDMTYQIRGMNMSMNRMQHDMTNMSRPMNFMNDFLPW